MGVFKNGIIRVGRTIGRTPPRLVGRGRGTIASGVDTDGKGVIFADLNGDKRVEYCDVDSSSSAMKAWLNVC